MRISTSRRTAWNKIPSDVSRATVKALAIAIGAAVTPALFAAVISGKVVDTSSHAVTSATVTISEEAASKTAPSTFHGSSTETAADGTFSFTNLEAGTYLLCAQVPKGTLLNPCQWTKTIPQVTIGSSAETASITLTMQPGFRLPIRVDDLQNLLTTNEGETPGAHLLIGVNGGYHFEVAGVDSNDSSGRNVSVLVPFDASIAVTVQSNFFKLQDAAGNAINKSALLPVTVSSAAPTTTLIVKVVGTYEAN